MNENIENKSDNRIKSLIGILLIMPIYMLILIVLKLLNLNNGNNYILFPLLMYLPIIIGMGLSYKIYKDKASKTIGICILILVCLALYFFYESYFIEHTGFDGIGYFVYWLSTTFICKISSCVFYGKIVGWKKALTFFAIYILIIVSSFTFGFWA